MSECKHILFIHQEHLICEECERDLGDPIIYISDLRAKLEAANTALEKINDIRNSIVGCQKINWSEHIYPLVAALNEAGLKGMGYPKAREYFGTLIERTVKAENDRDNLQAANAAQRGALEQIKLFTDQNENGKIPFRNYQTVSS